MPNGARLKDRAQGLGRVRGFLDTPVAGVPFVGEERGSGCAVSVHSCDCLGRFPSSPLFPESSTTPIQSNPIQSGPTRNHLTPALESLPGRF